MLAGVVVRPDSDAGSVPEPSPLRVSADSSKRLVDTWYEHRTALTTLPDDDWSEVRWVVSVAEILEEGRGVTEEQTRQHDESFEHVQTAIKRLKRHVS